MSLTSSNGALSLTANVWKLEVIAPKSVQAPSLSVFRVRASRRAATPLGRLETSRMWLASVGSDKW